MNTRGCSHFERSIDFHFFLFQKFTCFHCQTRFLGNPTHNIWNISQYSKPAADSGAVLFLYAHSGIDHSFPSKRISSKSQSSATLLRSRGNVEIPLNKAKRKQPHAVQPQPEARVGNVDLDFYLNSNFCLKPLRHCCKTFEMFFLSSVT